MSDPVQSNLLTQPLSKVAPRGGISLDLTKDDLVAIGMSREEVRLKNERKRLDDAISDVRKQYAARVSNMEKAALAYLVSQYANASGAVLQGIQGFSMKLVSNPSISLGDCLSNPKTTELAGEYAFSTSQESFKRGEEMFSIPVTITLQGGLEALRQELIQLMSVEKDLMAQAMEIRRNLGELDTLERQVKAQIAIKILQQSVDGQAMLDSIQDVRLLGAPQ